MAQADDIARAAEILAAGGLVAVPTETVYGLAADATNPEAVAKIFAAKGRPSGHPLIAHLGDASWLEQWTTGVTPLAAKLGQTLWPGPLTLIVGRGTAIPLAVTGGRETLAVRVPGHETTRAIIEALGRPIAAPSANRFGSVSPTRAQHVRDDLGDAVDLVVDGGPCQVGVESTIVDLTGDAPVIARPGAVTREQLEALAGQPIAVRSQGEVAAPGTLASHYAPKAVLRLVPFESLAAAVAAELDAGTKVGALAPNSMAAQLRPAMHAPFEREPERAAEQLYAGLRQLDDAGCAVIIAALPSEDGIGAAVADRMRRAAHGSQASS